MRNAVALDSGVEERAQDGVRQGAVDAGGDDISSAYEVRKAALGKTLQAA